MGLVWARLELTGIRHPGGHSGIILYKFSTALLATNRARTYYFIAMALIPIKTASETGYCDCICGCYELASLRDEDTGKGYCPACGKDHVELNTGVGIPFPAPARVSANAPGSHKSAA